MDDRPTLARRLLILYAATVVPVLVVLAFVLDRAVGSAVGGEPTIAVRAIVFGGTAAAAILGAIGAWLAGRSLARPIGEVSARVTRMARGDLGVRMPPGDTEELEDLSAALNRLADELEHRIGEIDRDRRTREAVLSAMGEGVVLIGPDDRLGYANPAATRLIGRLPETLRGLTPQAIRALVEDTRADDRARDREIEAGFPPRVLRVSTVSLREPGEVLVVLRDVTASRRVEAMRRDFVADASHELKTPAAAIQAAAETVERAVPDDPASAARFAAQLRRDAVRLSRIVSDLLDLSRLETERPALEPVRLDEVVNEEVDRLRSTADGVRIESSLRPVTVRGARRDLALLLRNLLDNAVRYSPQGGPVRVRLAELDGRAVLEVEDAGIGIPRRDLPRIFERFYRVDRARSRETGGTGLGLSIARHVVERHGGRIEADSELGQGSTFRVTLPASTTG